MTEAITRLAEIPAGYTHTEKSIVPADDLILPGAHLKWYDIYLAGRDTPAEVRDQAREFLKTEVDAGRLEFRDELGYAMLHLDGEGYFLLVIVWRNTNEMHQVLYGLGEDGFHPYPPKEGAFKPTQNVFELDCTSHERRAWSRYLTSARDEAAKKAYIADYCTGILV
ncbi:hypothetical protein D5S17_20505 [Pseudonocardiaceae bacterium YIM PH 21723]|nr:hypothetical protein D5S17_20505 [Pseudonocardiaceae bacterium YIM PH 21723]